MRWELSEEQGLFQESLRKWLQARVPTTLLRKWTSSGDAAPFDAALQTDGWLGVGHPEQWGGQGGGLIELALAAEEFGRASAPSSTWLASALALPSLSGVDGATKAVLVDGEPAVLAVPGDRIPSTVVPLGHRDGRVTGTVRQVIGGDRARHLVVSFVGDDGRRALGVVNAAAGGVRVRPRKVLDAALGVADLDFADASVQRLDVDGDAALRATDVRAAVLVAADALGAADRMLAMSVDYSRQRKQFGVPIGSFQAVKHAAASMLVTVEASRSIVYYAAASVAGDHPDCALHAAAAKAQVTGHVAELADTALTLHGAIGYTWEYDLQLFYKRAKVDAVLIGSVEAWNERLVAALPLLPG